MVRGKIPRRMYGTDAVARILDIEPWQVKAFGLKPYSLTPEQTGEGRGSRRRYSFHKLLQIDVANALSRKSKLLSSDMIVPAVQLITEDIISRWANSYDSEGNAPPIMLAFDGTGWEVLDKEDCTADFNESLENGDIWISLNLVSFWEGTLRRIDEFEADGVIGVV